MEGLAAASEPRRFAREDGDHGPWIPAAILALVALLLACSPVMAGPVLDRVRTAETVRCGAEARPGLAAAGAEGAVQGLALELCRAIALAVLGPRGRAAVSVIDRDADAAAVPDGRFDVVFLSGGTIAARHLADRLLLGPPAFVEATSVLVPEASPARTLRDLAGKGVCFMIGSGAHRALEAAIEREDIAILRLGFGEEAELTDAYNVGRCAAVAGDAALLAAVRRDPGIRGLRSRTLEATLGLDPVFMATGIEDARWSALATWTLYGVMLAAAPRSEWTGADAAERLAAAATPLGFREGWLKDVIATLGSYEDMVRRNLGDGSALARAPGPNAPWPAGLLLLPLSP